jgi:hypothetical protein
MRRSTGLASSPGLGRALIFLLPLLAACVFASPAQAGAGSRATTAPAGGAARAGVRSQAASEQAIASALSESTGLAPSQVTSAAVCPPAPAGSARCAAEALVLRSSHARVRPNVHGGATFTQVFPTRARGIPSARPADAGVAPPEPGTPAWLQQAYDLTYLSQTAGTGDTVAIVDVGDDPTAESDLAVFRSAYGLPACTTAGNCFEKVNEDGASSPLPTPADPGWQPEESLDLDAVSALCPNCHIVLVEASGSDDADLDAAVVAAATLGANQISNSWTATTSAPIGGTYTFSGASVIAATGDSGYVGEGSDNYPAAFPGVTAAGGTSLAPATGGGSVRGFSESAWSLEDGWGGGSGCDLNETKPSYQYDVGCTGRAYSDVSADADPDTGLMIYDSEIGGWWQYGGTSLATPLIAAYDAVTGVDHTTKTPQWAYSDSSLLNDPASGSSGDCDPTILYICDAGVGYDGPTGIGSISGAVAPGAPGIGGPSFGYGTGDTYTAGVGPTTASLSGGVYPNGVDTSYYWQYGPTISYGMQTAAVDIGAGQAPILATGALSGLAPGTTYHYRLVASNTDGTMYGYDSELTTQSAPVNTTPPSVGGLTLQGQTLYAYAGGWTPAGPSLTYQWQRSPDGAAWTSIAGATGSSYTLGAADGGDVIRVAVTAANYLGQSTATSAAVGPVPVAAAATPVTTFAAPRWTTRPQISAGLARVGTRLKITPATWTGSPLLSTVTQVMRCTNTCVAAGPANASSYTITPADVGSVLWVRQTVSNVAAGAVVWSAQPVGPVVSSSSAAVVLSGGQSPVRNSSGTALAFARITPLSAASDARRSRAVSRVLGLRRARGVSGRVTAWVCPVAGNVGGPPPRCTAQISLGARASVRLPASMTGKVRVVVIRRGR